MLGLFQEHIAVGGRVTMASSQGDSRNLIPAGRFYGALGAATLAVLAGVGGGYLDLRADLRGQNDRIINISSSVASMDGKLSALLPLVERMILDEISADPVSFGLKPIEIWREDLLKDGLNVVPIEIASQVPALREKAEAHLDEGVYMILDCSENSAAIKFGNKSCNIMDASSINTTKLSEQALNEIFRSKLAPE